MRSILLVTALLVPALLSGRSLATALPTGSDLPWFSTAAETELRLPPRKRLPKRPRLRLVMPGAATLAAGCNAIPPGLVDTVAVRVNDFVTINIVGIPPQDDDVYYQISTNSPGIVAAVDAVTGAQNPRVRVPKGSTVSEPFRLRGVQVGRTTLYSVPLFPGTGTIVTDTGAWELDGAFDFNALGQSDTCYDPLDPTSPNPDPLVRASCGGLPAEKVAADGVTRLLFRLRSGMVGKGCVRVISDAPPRQGSTTPMDDIPTEAADGDQWVFSTYLAPDDYEEISTSSRTVELEVAFTPRDAGGGYIFTNTTLYRTTLTIRRPPVVLLHGVWSDASTWAAAFRSPLPADGWHIEAGNYPNDQGFTESAARVGAILREAVANLRRERVAVSQTDVVAHSMGSLVTREWMRDTGYRRPDNLDAGDVRKLVSLHSPHQGSQFANMLINVHNNFTDIPLSRLWMLEKGLGNPHGGAVCDLAENSPAMVFPGANGVRVHAFTGGGGPLNALAGGLQTAIEWLFSDAEITEHMRPYYFADANDGIVSVASQSSGGLLPATHDATLTHSEGLGGPWVTASAQVAEAVYQRLDVTDGFATGLPAVAGTGDGAPAPGVGRGTPIDQANFTAQCGPGGPMLQAQRVTHVQPAANGITIVSPTADQVVSPGSTIEFRAEVDPLLQPAAAIVMANLQAGMTPLLFSGPPYTGQITVPAGWSGPLDLLFMVKDAAGNPVANDAVTIQVVPQEPPLRLEILTGDIDIDLEFASPPQEQMSVTGVYADGMERNLTAAVTGTLYRSLDPAVATVTTEGTVTGIAPGRTLIEVEHMGIVAWVEVRVHQGRQALPASDQTPWLQFHGSGFRLDRRTGNFVQTLTVTSTAPQPLQSPLYLILADLPPGVDLVNALGRTRQITPLGTPLLELTAGEPLMPGQSVTLRLEFINLQGVPITYTPEVYTTDNP